MSDNDRSVEQVSDNPPTCPSCGIAWREHDGPTGLCFALKAAQQRIAELERRNRLLRTVAEQARRNVMMEDDALRQPSLREYATWLSGRARAHESLKAAIEAARAAGV